MRNSFRATREQCRVGEWVEAVICGTLIAGVLLGAILGVSLVEMRGVR
jgi:hypothetical protein